MATKKTYNRGKYFVFQVGDIERTFGGFQGEFEAIDELQHVVAKTEDYVKWNSEQRKDHMKRVVTAIKKWALRKPVEEFSVSKTGFMVRNKTNTAKKPNQGGSRGSRGNRTRPRAKSAPNTQRGRGKSQGRGISQDQGGSSRSLSRKRSDKAAKKLPSFQGMV